MQDTRKKYSLDNVLLVIVIFMVARFSCIILSNVPLMSMSFIFVYGLVFTVFFIFSARFIKRREFVMLAFLLIYVIEVVLTTVVSVEEIFNTQAFNAYILFFLCFIYLFLKRLSKNSARIVFCVAMMGFLFTYIYSIIQLIQDPLLSRKAASGMVTGENVDLLGAVGGFDTVYGSVLVVCVLLFMWKSATRNTVKIFTFIVMLSCCVFLVMASYGTVLVLLVLLLGLWLFQKNRRMGLWVVMIGMLCFGFRESIGLMISEFSESITYSDMLKQKIDEIGIILSTGESVGTLAGEDGRWARMGWSWNAFVKYPVFGGFGKSDVQIGYHSELFDTLGRFGIVGAISLFSFIGLLFKDIYLGMETREGKKCCLICLILYVAVVVLNPALYTQQLLPIFVLLPCYELFCTKGGLKRE